MTLNIFFKQPNAEELKLREASESPRFAADLDAGYWQDDESADYKSNDVVEVAKESILVRSWGLEEPIQEVKPRSAGQKPPPKSGKPLSAKRRNSKQNLV